MSSWSPSPRFPRRWPHWRASSGADLFERRGRGVRLTAAGAAFAPYAEDVLGLLEQGRAGRPGGRRRRRPPAPDRCRHDRGGVVRPAADAGLFADRHPEIELTLAVGNRHDVLERVLDHSVDVAISGKPPADDRLVAER